jgi:DNA-binding NarL/FixJ family response regulator
MSYISPAAVAIGVEHHSIAGLEPQDPESVVTSQAMPPLKTYIVEDSQVIRENLIATLEELVPLKVIGTADDESSAVQWLTRPNNEVDLVIIDIFLKSGSGLGVLRAAHALPQRHTLVVLSNYATQDIRRKCLELGANRVFDKSNEIDALILYCGRLANGETDSSGDSGHGALS